MSIVVHEEDDESFSDESNPSLGKTPRSNFSTTGSAAAADGNHQVTTTSKESREVQQVKFVVILVVFMSALGALAVFFYYKRAEQNLFEKSFYSDGKKVLESLERSIELSLVTLDSLAMVTMSAARVANQTFPYVNVPDFGQHVAKIAPIVRATCTYFCPLVRPEQRNQWELFASGNNTILSSYVEETVRMQEDYPFYYGPKPQNYNWSYNDLIHDAILGTTLPYVATRPDRLNLYLPDFLKFPLITNFQPPANGGKYFVVFSCCCFFLLRHHGKANY
jgi:hypothetical protein